MAENQQSTSSDRLTPGDILAFDFNEVISDENLTTLNSFFKSRTCMAYEDAFVNAAKKYSESGQTKQQAICVLFASLCSYGLRLDDMKQPYTQKWSLEPITISQELGNLLKDVVPLIPDAELRARTADLLWVSKTGKYETAQLAINSYIESAQVLEDPIEWVDCGHRLERALQLAAQLGKKAKSFQAVVNIIEIWLDHYDGSDPLFLSHHLMTLLLDYKLGDPNKYSQLAEKIAREAENSSAWHKANEHWELKARWEIARNQLEEARAARLRAAETFISQAEERAEQSARDRWIAVKDLKFGLRRLQQYRADPSRIEHVRRLISEYQKSSNDGMSHESFSSDITQFRNHAVAAVSGKPLHEAMLELAHMARPMPHDEIKRQVMEMKKRSALFFYIETEQINSEGETVDRRPSAFSDDPDDVNKAMQAEMYRLSATYQAYQAVAAILPAAQQILTEHTIRYLDIHKFLGDTPLVSETQRHIVIRGLYSGFYGDFLVATHLLIPQLESSIRTLLARQGFITTTIKENGVESKLDLGTLLYLDRVKDVFGDDLLFTFRGLLIERFGSNLRNRFAHGIESEYLESEFAIYLWGLALYFYGTLPLIDAETAFTKGQQGELLGTEG